MPEKILPIFPQAGFLKERLPRHIFLDLVSYLLSYPIYSLCFIYRSFSVFFEYDKAMDSFYPPYASLPAWKGTVLVPKWGSVTLARAGSGLAGDEPTPLPRSGT
jgi:hypothetical protein